MYLWVCLCAFIDPLKLRQYSNELVDHSKLGSVCRELNSDKLSFISSFWDFSLAHWLLDWLNIVKKHEKTMLNKPVKCYEHL